MSSHRLLRLLTDLQHLLLVTCYVAPLLLLCSPKCNLSGCKPPCPAMLGITGITCRQSMPPERQARVPPLNTQAIPTTVMSTGLIYQNQTDKLTGVGSLAQPPMVQCQPTCSFSKLCLLRFIEPSLDVGVVPEFLDKGFLCVSCRPPAACGWC